LLIYFSTFKYTFLNNRVLTFNFSISILAQF